MLLPIYFVDLDKKSLQGSLNNFVKTELSNYYYLKSEKEVEQARDAAVDQISSENCTEEACVKVMGELLDVEYTFSLEIIDTGEGWDLSVVRQDMDGVTSRRNELCNECSLSKARKSLAGILTALRPGEMLIQRGKASLRLESTPRSQVFLDGREQGKTPLDLSVNARVPLEIFMVAEGYNDFAEEFTLKPGEKRKKHAKLTRKRGNIRITSNPPKASIYVDGKLEMDAQDKALQTPADLRLVYGQHELKLQLEKYEVATESLRINKKNLGTKNITLIPKPGRLIVRVPLEFKDAQIIINRREIGEMGGKVAKGFEVNANVSLKVQAKQGDFESDVESVEVGPEESVKVEFEFSEFSDLRLIALRKEQEEKEQKRQEAIIRKKKEREEQRRQQKEVSEYYDYKLGLIGSSSSSPRKRGDVESQEQYSISLFFDGIRPAFSSIDSIGIGITDLFVKTTSPAGHKYEFHNRSLDFTYSIQYERKSKGIDSSDFLFGMGVIVDGDAKSSTQNLKSDEVSGYRIMCLLGTNSGNAGLIFGYQYSSFEYKKLTTTNNLSMSGGTYVFGIGVRF